MRILHLLIAIVTVIGFAGCKDKTPDVSGIKVNLAVQRFEQDFFTADTVHVAQGLNNLHKKYGNFFSSDFVFNILGAGSGNPDEELTYIQSFRRAYYSIYQDVSKKFSSFDTYTDEIRKGLQYVKYYFPDYKVPDRIITFVGPLDGTASAIAQNSLAIGLQLYMGHDYAPYNSPYLANIYPAYVSRRFEPAYIPVNSMKNVIDELYPDNYGTLPLVEQMVEQGKRLYLLDKFLPHTADSLKTGYTQKQLQGCYDSEATIWNFFLQSDILYSKDPAILKDYLDEGPTTQALGEGSPGNIGKFTGWQIVKKWMDSHSSATLKELMQTSADKVFREAKYKPK